jgi:predicted permease
VWHGLASDVRSAFRSLGTAPAVVVAAIATLTLGIGATTALFAVANTLVLRPLPVPYPERLVTITSETALRHGFQAGAGWNYPMWDRLRQRVDLFAGAFAWTLQRFDLSDGGEMQPANTLVASGEAFAVLGVSPVLGRSFSAADDVGTGGGDGAVAVISHRLWQRRFHGSADIIGTRLNIERIPVTIVGVAPAWFKGIDVGQPFDVAIPFATESLLRGRRSLQNNERALLLTVMLRLKPGQHVAEATAALRTMQPQIVGPTAPEFLKEPFLVVDASRGISDRSRLRQQYQYPLLILSIVSGIVQVIVCLNIANLLLSRTSVRRADFSVRVALGASRWRLMRLGVVEAAVLAGLGTASGLVFGAWTSRALVAQLPFSDGAIAVDPVMDWRVVLFTAGIAITAVVIFAAAPAAYALRVAPVETLRHTGPARRHTSVISGGLVVSQIALSIVLLAAAGLFGRTLDALIKVPLGFDPSGVIVATVNTARAISHNADASELQRRMLRSVSAAPGVVRVAASTWTPVGTGGGGVLTDARGRRAGEARGAAYNFITPGWLTTYSMTMRSGRDFDDRDATGAPRVAIVNESLAGTLPAGGDPLGQIIDAGPCGETGCTVVGIVADAIYGSSLRDAAPPTVFLPVAQSAGLTPPNAVIRLSIRAGGDPAGVIPAVTDALRNVDSGLTFTFRRLDDHLEAAVAQERLLAVLATGFGIVALLLCAVGLYGVSAHAGARRRVEIAIRVALGGDPRAVLRSILQGSATLLLLGTMLGLAAALWLSRFATPLLYGLAPHDPLTLLAAALLLVTIAMAAAWLPASRAVRADPAQVLREN